MRKPVNHAFSITAILDYEPYVDSTSLLLTDRLTSLYADKDIVCNLGEWLQWFAFDVVGELTYSRRLGFLDQGKDVDGIIRSIGRQLDYAAIVSYIPPFTHRVFPKKLVLTNSSPRRELKVSQMPWLDHFLEKNPIWSRFKNYTAPIAAFTLARMKERHAEMDATKDQVDGRASYVGRKDMMSKFIEARIKDPENVSEYYVLSWTNTNSFAGSDTTAIVLRALFYYLLKNPQLLARLRSEIGPAGELSNPISWADTKKLPYLDACIKETLRLHPPIPMILERVVPKGGYEICGKFFEEGTIVGLNPWVAQQDKRVFGDDADQWNPDRWLVDEATRKRMNRCILTVCIHSTHAPSFTFVKL